MLRIEETLSLITVAQEWKEAASALDSYLHFDEWKKVDEDPFYDWKLIRKVELP